MDALARVRRLLDYHNWANRESLNSLRAAATPPPRALERLGHLAASDRLWLSRIVRDDRRVAVWPVLSLDECSRAFDEAAIAWRAWSDGLAESGLRERVSYLNSRGESWSSAPDDIVTHLVIHGAYHRGQIATDLAAAGHQPAYTDYIHFVRSVLPAM